MSYLEKIQQIDPDLYELAVQEAGRQRSKLCLIPSENYASEDVYKAATTLFNNKYAEGYPGKRYYEGCEVVDGLENLVNDRLKTIFDMPNANSQCYSGSPANLAVYSALLAPGDKILGMHLPSGGHLSHGWPVTATGRFFESSFYGYNAAKNITGLNPDTGMLEYDEIRETARRERPAIIVAGASSYPRIVDFEAFGEIAREVGALLLADISHINGLIVGGVHPSPSGHADIVSSTTHKMLRGPRGAFILSNERTIERKGKDLKISDLLNKGVFPFLQGGAHYSAIAALAVALTEATKPDFTAYAEQVVRNAKRLADELMAQGCELVTGGTDNHLMIIDVAKSFGVGGKDVAKALDKAGIVVNFNTVPNDSRPPANPSGIRIGTPAITSRGFDEADMEKVASWMLTIIKDPSDANILKTRGEIAEFCANPKYDIPGLSGEDDKEIASLYDWKEEDGLVAAAGVGADA